jgi:hypothetical protein
MDTPPKKTPSNEMSKKKTPSNEMLDEMSNEINNMKTPEPPSVACTIRSPMKKKKKKKKRPIDLKELSSDEISSSDELSSSELVDIELLDSDLEFSFD